MLTLVVLDPALISRQVVPGFKGLLNLSVGQVNDACGVPSAGHGSALRPQHPDIPPRAPQHLQTRSQPSRHPHGCRAGKPPQFGTGMARSCPVLSILCSPPAKGAAGSPYLGRGRWSRTEGVSGRAHGPVLEGREAQG